MTTSVKVKACVAPEKEVVVSLSNGSDVETTKLQDGEEQEFYVYDDRTISVVEIVKE